jgi:hypothetical protein
MNVCRPALAASVLMLLAAAAPAPDKPDKPDKKKKDEPSAARAVPCTATGGLTALDQLPEASGLALSRRTRGLLWSHNDSGAPVVLAVDTAGAVKGRVAVTGAGVVDWEDVEVGACASGPCLYVADIGDNRAVRRQITVYRVPEPQPGDTATAAAEAFHARYPDGPQDAEALLVTGAGELLIATKGETGPSALYRFPKPLRAGATATLERLAALDLGPRADGRRRSRARITDGAVSPDGQWAALRTHDAVVFYRAADLAAGRPREVFRAPLTALRERQGEGLALAGDGEVYLCGEGGGRRGTFARLRCTLPPAS